MADASDPRRRVPSTDSVLADPLLSDALGRLDREVVKAAVRDAQQQVREGALAPEALTGMVAATLRPASVRSPGAAWHAGSST